MTLLITGGAGYIGAHIAYRALEEGYKVTIFDNDNDVNESYHTYGN